MDTAAKVGLDTLKTASKKVAHWAAETTDEFTRNKIADKIVKPKPASNENLRDIGKTIIPTEKAEILNELRQKL